MQSGRQNHEKSVPYFWGLSASDSTMACGRRLAQPAKWDDLGFKLEWPRPRLSLSGLNAEGL